MEIFQDEAESIICLLVSISSSLTLIARVAIGECPNDISIYRSVSCNPQAACKIAPLDATLICYISFLFVHIFIKRVRKWVIVLSWAIGFFTVMGSMIYFQDAVHVWGLLFSLFFLLIAYEFERTQMSAFLQTKHALEEEKLKRLEMEREHIEKDEIIAQLNQVKLRDEKSRYDLEILELTAENDVKLMELEATQLRSLMGNVAHDLKTPIHSIVMDVEMLKSFYGNLSIQYPNMTKSYEDDEDSDPVTVFESLEATCAFMTMGINRCLDYMKASSNIALNPTMETFEIQSTLTIPVRCIKHHLQKEDQSRIILHPISIEICPFIISDKHWFSENLLCLLSNAIKYSDKKTSVDIRISLISDSFITTEISENTVSMNTSAVPGSSSVRNANSSPNLTDNTSHYSPAGTLTGGGGSGSNGVAVTRIGGGNNVTAATSGSGRGESIRRTGELYASQNTALSVASVVSTSGSTADGSGGIRSFSMSRHESATGGAVILEPEEMRGLAKLKFSRSQSNQMYPYTQNQNSNVTQTYGPAYNNNNNNNNNFISRLNGGGSTNNVGNNSPRQVTGVTSGVTGATTVGNGVTSTGGHGRRSLHYSIETRNSNYIIGNNTNNTMTPATVGSASVNNSNSVSPSASVLSMGAGLYNTRSTNSISQQVSVGGGSGSRGGGFFTQSSIGRPSDTSGSDLSTARSYASTNISSVNMNGGSSKFLGGGVSSSSSVYGLGGNSGISGVNTSGSGSGGHYNYPPNNMSSKSFLWEAGSGSGKGLSQLSHPQSVNQSHSHSHSQSRSQPLTPAAPRLMIRVAVEDRGIGVSPEVRKVLFRPFKQAQRMAGGTGLGLYSLYKRMEALKGLCGIDSRADGQSGSVFWFAFPYRPDSSHSTIGFGGDVGLGSSSSSSNTNPALTGLTETNSSSSTSISTSNNNHHTNIISPAPTNSYESNRLLPPLYISPSNKGSFAALSGIGEEDHSGGNSNDNNNNSNNNNSSSSSSGSNSFNTTPVMFLPLNSSSYSPKSGVGMSVGSNSKETGIASMSSPTSNTVSNFSATDSATSRNSNFSYHTSSTGSASALSYIPTFYSNNNNNNNNITTSNNIALSTGMIQPYTIATGIPPPITTPIPTFTLPSIRILMVDDSSSILKITSRSLRTNGHTVQVEENGSLGLERLKSGYIAHEFDILLTDLQMPVMDGFEFVKRFRVYENKVLEQERVNERNSIISLHLNASTDSFADIQAMNATHSVRNTSTNTNTAHNDEDIHSSCVMVEDGIINSNETNPRTGSVSSANATNTTTNNNSNTHIMPPPKISNIHGRFLIIGMSANSDDVSKQEALNAGMDGFICKPFTYLEFVQTLQPYFSSSLKKME